MLEVLEPRMLLSGTLLAEDALVEVGTGGAVVRVAWAEPGSGPLTGDGVKVGGSVAAVAGGVLQYVIEDVDGNTLATGDTVVGAEVVVTLDLGSTAEFVLRVGTEAEDLVVDEDLVYEVIEITAGDEVSYVAYPSSLSLARPDRGESPAFSEPVHVDVEDEDGNDAGFPAPFQVFVLDSDGRPAQGISVTVTYRADNDPIAQFTVSVSEKAKLGDYTIQVRPQDRGVEISRLLMPLWVEKSR